MCTAGVDVYTAGISVKVTAKSLCTNEPPVGL